MRSSQEEFEYLQLKTKKHLPLLRRLTPDGSKQLLHWIYHLRQSFQQLVI